MLSLDLHMDPDEEKVASDVASGRDPRGRFFVCCRTLLLRVGGAL